jgi:hypothetical protein
MMNWKPTDLSRLSSVSSARLLASEQNSFCRVNLELLRSDIGPDVWSGRALQEVFADLSDVGLASMYPASHWSVSECIGSENSGAKDISQKK